MMNWTKFQTYGMAPDKAFEVLYSLWPLLLLLFTSIPVLMLSGVSYPREGIPDWLFNLGQLFPSSHGVNGFIRIQSMGASIPEVFAEIKWLIILTVAYGGLACIGIHQVIRREQRQLRNRTLGNEK